MKASRHPGAWVLAAALLAGCGSMQVAEKNLEEGRLVPAAAVAGVDFLNEYRHPLATPRQAIAGLDLALERKNVLAPGGRLLVQIGIATAAPVLRPVNVHALVFAPANPGRSEAAQLTRAVEAVRGRLAARGGTLTVDFVQPVASLGVAEPSLLHASRSGSLKDFLTPFVRHPLEDGEHHFVLLVGSYKGLLDLPGLSERERQDLVDLGRILAAKSVTLSVLSVGDKPDFAFLRRLGETGGGTFTVATDSLDYNAWIEEDLRARSAQTLSDVELTLAAKNGARLTRVLSPRDLRHSENGATYSLARLREGEQRVVLAELEIPAGKPRSAVEILDAELKYFAPAVKRYFRVRESSAIQYVDDPNLALPAEDDAVQRSLLILETQATLQSVAREIRNRRTYQAIALLARQGRALKQTGSKLNDRELLRDAAILTQYADRLYDFDGEWFQSVKIWHDLSWDTERFRSAYK